MYVLISIINYYGTAQLICIKQIFSLTIVKQCRYHISHALLLLVALANNCVYMLLSQYPNFTHTSSTGNLTIDFIGAMSEIMITEKCPIPHLYI